MRNTFQWNIVWNLKVFTQENAFKKSPFCLCLNELILVFTPTCKDEDLLLVVRSSVCAVFSSDRSLSAASVRLCIWLEAEPRPCSLCCTRPDRRDTYGGKEEIVSQWWERALKVINSLAPGRWCSNLTCVISEHISWIKLMSTSCEIALRWMPQNTKDDKSILVHEMAWWHQATSHYLRQCWVNSMSP